MLHKRIAVLYLLFGTAFCISHADARPAQPGRAWVQSHPFQISAAAMSHTYWNVNTYKACNLNAAHPWQLLPNYPHGNTVILNSCKSNGVMIHPDIRGTHLHSGLINFINSVSNSSSDFAWYVMDEPPSSMFPGIADVVNWLKTNRPNGLIYLGTADTTDAYLDPMIAQIQPDALSFCCYPYYLNTTRLDWWWSGTSRIRNKTLYHGIPYFAWIQAFAGDGQWRIPTEGDVRMQVFSSLTAGAKGIFYWMWDRDQWPDWTYTITDPGGAPNTLYYQVQAISAEVANLGNSLRFLHSADLRYVRGRRTSSTWNPVPSGLSNWSFGAGGNTKITGVQVDSGQNGAEKDGLIGLFNYDGPDPQYSGMQYFMLTNVYRAGSLNFTVTFDSSVNVLHRLSRATGQWVAVYPSGNTLNLNLPAGTGELFAIVEGSGPSPEPDDPFTDDRFCSIDLGTTNVSNKLTHPQNSDGDTTATNAGGLNCRRPVDSGDQYFYFAIDDSFLYDLPGTTTYLEVSYFDDQPSAAYLCPQYDSTSSAYTNAAPVYFTNSGKWKISTWALTGCKFANRQNAGADFRIYVGQYSVKIDSVRVSKVPFSDYNTVGRDLGANEEYRGLSHPFNWSGSDGKTVVVEHAGVSCRKPQGSGDNFFYFNVSDAIMFNGNPSTVYLKVEYFDSPGGMIQPEYDSNSGTYTAGSTLNFAGTNMWRQAHWTLNNVKFANSQNGSADFRLFVGTNQSVHINRVWVSKQAFPIDTQAPSTPTNLQATAQSETSVQLTWTASTDNVGVTGYKVFRNGVQIATSATNSYLNTGLSPATTYSYRVSAYDAAGNESSQSAQAVVTTPDNTPPSVPSNVQGTVKTPRMIDLTWSASTDNVGVTGYKIYRNGSHVGTSATTGYTDSGLVPGATYSYTVSAYDAAGNHSAQSTQVVKTTSAALSITEVKGSPDNISVGMVSQIVTAVFDGYLYIGEPDRYTGIRVVPLEMPQGIGVGSLIDIGGTMQTMDGERFIDQAVIVIVGGE